MAKARLPSAERWLVALISVLTFTVALQLTMLLCPGSGPGLAKTQLASQKHISRFVVPTAFNSSLEKRGKSVDSDDYMGDDESSLSDSSARSSSHSGKQGGQQADYDRKSQQDDGEEGKDIVYQNHNWNKCVRKGSELVGLFSRPSIPKADESRFTDYRDLQRYGWEVLEKGIDPTHEDNTLSKPLDMLKIAHGKGVPEDKWHYLQVTHSKDSRDASGGYPATDGKFHMTHNPQDHIIIAEDLLSPASTASGTWLSPQHVTPLKFVSDVMFLNWVYECRQTKSSPASLKYYMVPSIVNYDTRSAVREAVGGFLAKQLPAWPGVVFTKDHDGDKFSALLGTPVGGSIARMLVQRKSTMGRDRSIVGIRVWAEQPGSDRWFKEHGPVLSMLFELSGLRSNPSRTNAGAGSSAGHVQQIRRSSRRGGGRRPWHNTPPVRSAVPAAVSAVSGMVDDATASAVAFQGHVSAAASRASDLFSGATAAATVLRGQGSAAVSKASGLFDGATASASVLKGKGPAVASKASSLLAATTSSAVSQRQGTAAASVASTSFSSANGSSIADWKARRSLQKSGFLSRAAEDHRND